MRSSTVKQLSSFDHDPNRVIKLVGKLSHKLLDTWTCKLNDCTGEVTVSWNVTVDTIINSVDDQIRRELDETVDVAPECTPPPWTEGKYHSVFGVYNNHTHLFESLQIQELKDMNEVTFHNLESIHQTILTK